jgi:signal transduction histidine kinase
VTGRSRARQALIVAVAAGAALCLGAVTVHFVRAEPGFALAGSGATGLVTVLLPGTALCVVGVIGVLRRQEVTASWWFTATGTAWFLGEWNNPAAAPAVAFTTGLLLYGVTSPTLVQGVLSYPSGRSTIPLRALMIAGWAVTLLGLGLLPAMLADPAASGCRDCPEDLVAVTQHPGAAAEVTRSALTLAAAWSVAAAVVIVRRSLTGSRTLRRSRLGVSCAASAYLAIGAAGMVHLLAGDSLNIDSGLRRLHAGQALALVLVAVAVVWGWTRRRRTRRRLARLVVELADTPPPGGLRDLLASSLGDQTLQVGYWLSDGGLVDVTGRPVQVAGASTPLLRGGRPVALMTHRPGLLDDARTADEVAVTARLALENERLQAELAAQLTHLRSSRRRLIAVSDAARRRLERDLHDGAQQQLVGLLLRLRLDRRRWPPDGESSRIARDVEGELVAAVDELRELARGIFPSVLTEEGLAAAIEDFAESADVPVTVGRLPNRRLADAVESAGYFVIAESVRRTMASAAVVSAAEDEDLLRVDVQLTGAQQPESWVTAAEDRIGALDGHLEVVTRNGDLGLRAVIPCG